jgi:hypothetical protein
MENKFIAFARQIHSNQEDENSINLKGRNKIINLK